MTTAAKLYPETYDMLEEEHIKASDKLLRYLRLLECHGLAEVVDALRVVDIERHGIEEREIYGTVDAQIAEVNMRDWLDRVTAANVWLTKQIDSLGTIPPAFDETIGRICNE